MVKLSREQAYEVLAVQPDASEDEIKRAYHKQALKWHPDKNLDDTEAANAKFQEVYAAYTKLTQPEQEEDGIEMDMSDAFSCFMHMMQMANMRGGTRAAPGGFNFTFMGPFSMGGGPSVFGGSRAPPFFSDMYDYDDDEDEDEDDDLEFYPRRYSRMEQQRAEQQWQRDRRAERLARRHEKEAAAKNEQRQKRAEQEREAAAERKRRQQAQAAKPPKFTPEEILAQQEEEVRKQIPKLPRPTMADRTEDVISLNLSRGGRDQQGNTLWEVAYHALHEPNWTHIEGQNDGTTVTCTNLQPRTKYVIKARAGQYATSGKAVWGEWSVESQYVTLGQAAAPASAPAAEPAAAPAKKGRKKAADKKGDKKTSGAQQTASDEQAAIEQLKAQQEKEAAMAAAVEQAAADYAAEVAKLQAPKAAAAQEAAAESKKKKKRNKHKKAPLQQESSEVPSEQKQENVSQQPNSAPAQGQRQHPTTTHLHPAPPSHQARAARDFGLGLPGEGPAQQRAQQAAAAAGRPDPSRGAHREPGLSPADMEQLNIQEAIQISQALEESMRMYEAENRRAPPNASLAVDEDKFPSLPGGPPSSTTPPLQSAAPPQQTKHSSTSAAVKPQQPSTRAKPPPSDSRPKQPSKPAGISWNGASQHQSNPDRQNPEAEPWTSYNQNGWDPDPNDDDQAEWPMAKPDQTNQPVLDLPNGREAATDRHQGWQNKKDGWQQREEEGYGGQHLRQENGWDQSLGKENHWGQSQHQSGQGLQQPQGRETAPHQPAAAQPQQQGSWQQPQQQGQGSWDQPQQQGQGGWEQPQHEGSWQRPQHQIQQQSSWDHPQHQPDQRESQHHNSWDQPYQQHSSWDQHLQSQDNLKQSHAADSSSHFQHQGNWDQPYDYNGWDQRQEQDSWVHHQRQNSPLQQTIHDQPQYRGNYQQPHQQGTWDQPNQDQAPNFWDEPSRQSSHQPHHHYSLNQGGWDLPDQEPGSNHIQGSWENGVDQQYQVPGLDWQGHGRTGPEAAGQTQWDPTPDSHRSGLTTASLAHHDKLTGADIRKAERQKASIDRWNAEGTGSSVTNQHPERWLNQQYSSVADHHQDHPYTSYDDPGLSQHQNHQSALSHQHVNATPVKRYDPYDLSPANLVSYPDNLVYNPAEPAQYGQHQAPKPDQGFGKYGMNAYHQKHSSTYSYANGDQDQGYSNDHYASHDHSAAGYDAAYTGGHVNAHQPYRAPAQQASQKQSSWDQDVRQGSQNQSSWEQNARQGSQHLPQQRSSRTSKASQPPQSSVGVTWEPEDQTNGKQRQHEPLPASGCDDDAEQVASSNIEGSGHLGQQHGNESSKWSAPIETDQRQREAPTRGRGRASSRGKRRGGRQQGSDRPVSQQQDNQKVQQPNPQSAGMMSESDALKIMQQGQHHDSLPADAQQFRQRQASRSYQPRSKPQTHSKANCGAAATLFVLDLFPKETA